MIDRIAEKSCAAGEASGVQLRQILAVLSGFQLLLIILTWPLWTGTSVFPQVALLSPCRRAPDALQSSLLLVQIISLVAILVSCTGIRFSWHPAVRCNGNDRWVLWLAILSGSILVAVNQHRLQPWYWLALQCWLFAVVFKARQALQLIRLSVVCVYWFSAVSRISPEISESMTGQVVRVLLLIAGLKLPAADPDFVNSVAWVFTAGEFLTGWLLLIPRFRQYGIVLAMLLHLTLMVALSPVGLGHHHGVLVWNVMFVFFVPLLFRVPAADSPITSKGSEVSVLHRGACWGAAAMVILLPLSGLFGFFDNWPSWQLYSPRPEVWKVYVRDGAATELPESVQPFVGPLIPFDEWRPIRIDRWSLAATGAPLYPEDRFQLALIEWMTRDLSRHDDIKVVIEAPLTFPFWRRSVTEIHNREELRALQDHGMLNDRIISRIR